MNALLEALGGRDDVAATLYISRSAIKAALFNRVFPPNWFGPLLAMAAARGIAELPADLFGTSQATAWDLPPVCVPKIEQHHAR